MPANQSNAVNREMLMMPDRLTEVDLFAPLPDPSLLFSQSADLAGTQQDNTILSFDDSQHLLGSIERARREEPASLGFGEADDLNLDIGDDFTVPEDGPSIERLRDAPPPREASEEYGIDSKLDDLGLDIADDGELQDNTTIEPPKMSDDIEMAIVDDVVEEPEVNITGGDERLREEHSPLSSIRSSQERRLEGMNKQEDASAFVPQEDEEISIHPAHKAKKRKILHADQDTELANSQIREQQNDRSNILKPASFLPRDPMLLALLTMQKNGGFVSSILGEGRSIGWAPELRGILSLEVIRESGDLKRKRGKALVRMDEDSELHHHDLPQLQLDDEQVETGGLTGEGNEADITEGENEALDLPDGGPVQSPRAEERFEDDILSPIVDNFDDTTVPLLHPSESGPVSLGTKHVVHVLREQFGPDAADSPSKRQQKAVKFQDLLPEQTTSRSNATKMFFEVLVLATKDAIKVEQVGKGIGGPIRIRAKRSLWGSWAETQAGGEIATQEEGVAAGA